MTPSRPAYARAMTAYGWTSLVLACLGLVKPVLDTLRILNNAGDPSRASAAIVGGALAFGIGLIPIGGSWLVIQAFRASPTDPETHRRRRVAAIICLVPCLTFGLLWPVALGLGIWALIALNRTA